MGHRSGGRAQLAAANAAGQAPAGRSAEPWPGPRAVATEPGRPEALPYLLYAAATWSLLCAILAAENLASIDLWGRWSLPAVWLASGAFPYRDDFSYTAPGYPWIDHEWLSGVVFYGVMRVAGEPGLTLLKAIAVAATIVPVFWAARRRGLSPLWPFTVLLAGVPRLESGFLTTGRPQNFTFAFFALVLALLESVRHGNRARRLWWLVPLGLVWSNLHGGFLAGAGLAFLYGVGTAVTARAGATRRALPYLAAAGGMVAVSLVNPYGWRYWPFMWATIRNKAMIDEWQPVPLAGADFLVSKALAVVTLVGLGVWAWSTWLGRTRPGAATTGGTDPSRGGGLGREPAGRLPHGSHAIPNAADGPPAAAVPPLVLAVLLYVGFRHLKHQPLFVLGAAVYLPLLLAGPLSAWWRSSGAARLARGRTPGLWRVLADAGLPLGLLVGAALHLALLARDTDPLRIRVPAEDEPASALKLPPYPVHAVEFLAASPFEGRLFTPFLWGEFVYWRLYPRFRVSLDARFDVSYPVPTAEWLNGFYTTRGLDWSVPDQSGADLILLEKDFYWAHPDPSGRLDIPAPWVVVYDNPHFTVLAHPRAIARAQGSAPVGGVGLAVQGGRSVSAFWHPAADRQRFARYGAPPSEGVSGRVATP